MTCREKIALERPDRIDSECLGGVEDCPNSYGYMEKPQYCDLGSTPELCTKCWDREIPGTEKLNTPKEPHILDSGNRREFESGAVRDIQEGKGRCDLAPLDVMAQLLFSHDRETDCVLKAIYKFQDTGDSEILYAALEVFSYHFDDDSMKCIPTMLLEVSKHFEDGAKKYGENNWQKGIPVHCYIDSAVRHYLKFLRGDKDEPHDRAFVWNLMCCIWTCKHKPELNEYRKENKE